MTEEPQEYILAPRLKANKDIYDKLDLPPRYPQVSQQVEAVSVSGLPPFSYNPSIIEHEGKLWMAFRHHPNGSIESKICVCNVTEDGKSRDTFQLKIDGLSVEDPRLFVHHGKLHISWVDSLFPSQLKAQVKYGAIENDTVPNPVVARFPGNDMTSIQKNYVFFEHHEKLLCIYNSEQVVYEMNGSDFPIAHKSTGPVWPYGQIRGGTVPIPHEGRLLRFFHSGADTEPKGPQRRRYCIGAALMFADPPYQTVEVSKRPVLWGSEVPVTPWRCFKPMVVFCSGAVQREWGWLLSVGCNDSSCMLAKVTDLKL